MFKKLVAVGGSSLMLSLICCATGSASGVGSIIGGAMFGSSMAAGGKFANDVVGAVATGNIAAVGSIKGEKAAQALTNYLGYTNSSSSEFGAVECPAGDTVGSVIAGHEIGTAMDGEEHDTVTIDGGTAAGGRTPDIAPAGGIPTVPASIDQNTPVDDGAAGGYGTVTGAPTTIPAEPPTFRDVEIGGGRITGYETPAGGGEERQFAMYNAAQYMAPATPFETVQTVDGESWYKQYAQPTVQRTPHKDSSGKITYDEKIVEQLPQIPKRKDRV